MPKIQRFCEIIGGPSLGGPSFRYRLTEAGHARARAAFERNQYYGYAPISMAAYRRYTDEFRRSVTRAVTSEEHAAPGPRGSDVLVSLLLGWLDGPARRLVVARLFVTRRVGCPVAWTLPDAWWTGA